MQISKFRAQHRNKCYCQMKRECYVKNVNKVDNNRNNKKHYFVKNRNSCCLNSTEYKPIAQPLKPKMHPIGMSSEFSTMQEMCQRLPNHQFNTTSCNHETNSISRNILNNTTLHRINRDTIQTNNYHSDEGSNIPNLKRFNVIYDRYDKLREIETFRAENANECISVLNQQTNHNRVPNKSVVKHVCQHRYRYLMEPTISNGRGESKCELCDKWCGAEHLKYTVASGNCCIVDKIDSSNFMNCGDATDDFRIILEVQNLDISSEGKPKTKQLKKKTSNRSWYLMEQAKSLALNQQERS